MFFIAKNDNDTIGVIEGDTEEQAAQFLLNSDDRLDSEIMSQLDFEPVTIYSRQRNLRDYDDCNHELKRITEEIREIAEYMMGYETSEGQHMPSTAQTVLYNKKQIMTGIATLHDILNR
jgi:hypothetical protein